MSSGRFMGLVEEYLSFRRGLGFDLRTPAWTLRSFARHADELGLQGHLTVDVVVQWARSGCPEEPARASRRLAKVRGFVRYLAMLDPATEVPSAGVLGTRSRRKPPHLYSDEEIAALLAQARLLWPRGGLRPVTYVTFFSLLVSTGLRLSEACRLAAGDVDLVDGVLTIRESKFRKSRLVPLHPTTTTALRCYAAQRDAYGPGHFFRTDQVATLSQASVEKTFSRLRARLGWTTEGRARRPRIHDLRFTFAARRLLCWSRDGIDVDRKMLALATYLGHAKVTDTYWYLSAVPELMAITSERFERFAELGGRTP